MFLTEPSLQYKDTFLNGVREFQNEGRLLVYDISRISANFDHFLQQQRELGNRSNVPPGRVPSSDFWLIDNGEYIGHLCNSVRCLAKMREYLASPTTTNKIRHSDGWKAGAAGSGDTRQCT